MLKLLQVRTYPRLHRIKRTRDPFQIPWESCEVHMYYDKFYLRFLVTDGGPHKNLMEVLQFIAKTDHREIYDRTTEMFGNMVNGGVKVLRPGIAFALSKKLHDLFDYHLDPNRILCYVSEELTREDMISHD